MISSINHTAAAALVPRPHGAAPGVRPQDGARGTPESTKPGAARPGGGAPSGPLLGTATVAALQELSQGNEAQSQEGEGDTAAPAPTEPAAAPGGDLSAEEKREVQELKRIDAEVRRHEAAHASAGGAYAGAPSYTYQTGPDGKRYAVGGEVAIDTAPVAGDPEATIRKMRTVQRAANAPSEPSGQDRAVAAAAARTEQQARAELAAQRREDGGEGEGVEGAQSSGAKAPEASFGREAGTHTSGETSSLNPSIHGRADSRPGSVIQIATQRYGKAAALVAADDRTGANASNRLDPFQAVGTATPRIERFA